MGSSEAWWPLPVRFFVELFHCLLPCHYPSSEAFRVCYPSSGNNAKQFFNDSSRYILTSAGKQDLVTTDNVLESIRSAAVQVSSQSFQHVDASSDALKAAPVTTTTTGPDFATVSTCKYNSNTNTKPTLAHSRYYTKKILKHLQTLLDDPELKTHENTPDDPGINFSVPYKLGIIFIAISKTGLSLWVHAPATPGPSGSNTASRRGRGGGRGVRRTGAGVGRSRGGRGGRPTAGRNTNGAGDDNADNDGDGDGDGNNDDNGNNGNYDGVVVTPRFLACPFYKFDPVRHFRCFRKYDMRRYSDVKQHILRCHSLGEYYCAFCWKTWKSDNEAGWRAHIEALVHRMCDHVPQPEHLFPTEVSAMNHLEFGQQANDAQKWYHLWDLLFMGHTAPPSPYVETELGEISQLLSRSRDDVMQAIPSLLQTANIQIDRATAQALAQHIHIIYCFQFTPQGQLQSPRYRRQHATQNQAQPAAQVQPAAQAFGQAFSQAFSQAPNPAVADAGMMNTVVPGMLTLNNINEDDWNEYINQQTVDEMDDSINMMGNFQPGPPAPPPPPAPQGY